MYSRGFVLTITLDEPLCLALLKDSVAFPISIAHLERAAVFTALSTELWEALVSVEPKVEFPVSGTWLK